MTTFLNKEKQKKPTPHKEVLCFCFSDLLKMKLLLVRMFYIFHPPAAINWIMY